MIFQGSLLQNVIRKLEDRWVCSSLCTAHQLLTLSRVLCSMDDDERRQHYKEVQDDLEVEEDRMETLVKGE